MEPTSPSGTCRLCHQPQPLVCSHIIPEFFYKPLYDDLHRCFEKSRLDAPEEKRIHQKGLRQRLLCAECDRDVLGPHEHYMAEVLFGQSRVACEQTDSGFVVRGLSYEHVRLFQLSLLWRASVSTLNQFAEVSLGPHEEKIRQMILVSDPGDHDRYPCIVCVPAEIFRTLGRKGIKMFQAERIKGHRVYDVYCGGLGWVFVVSSHSKGRVGENMVITTDGTLPILL